MKNLIFTGFSPTNYGFFHQGSPLEILLLNDGKLSRILLGNNLEKDEVPQAVIPANTWFASKIKSSEGYALVSCTVAPGFDFADFELADKENLMLEYAEFKAIIEELSI